MTIRVTIKGTKALNRQFRRYGREAILGLKTGLSQEAEGIITQSKGIIPIDTGNLRASGHVQPPEVFGSRASVEFGFGGPSGSGNVSGDTNSENVDYAVKVHEDLESFHRVGQAKYLEVPVNRAIPGMSDRIAKDVSRQAGRKL